MSAAGTASPPGSRTSTNGCPRCHSTKPWGQNSWCPDCGYYPVVDRSAANGSSWADNLPELPQEEVEDDRSALQAIPVWFWIMLGGVVGVTVFSVVVRVALADDETLRGRVALTQLVIGLLTALTAHGVAAKFAMASDRRVNLNDVLLSWFNVWQPTISRLPDTCRRIWGMVWGCTAFLTAVTIIGGIDYSAPFRVHKAPDIKPMKLIGAVAGAAKAQAAKDGDPASLSEALGDLAGEVEELQNGELNGKSMEEALNELKDIDKDLNGLNVNPDDLPKPRMTLTCYIYGVVTDRKNVPRIFLFGANTTGQDQHVAEIAGENLPPDVYRKIVTRLYPAVRSESLIPTNRKGIWVEPIVNCRLSFADYGEDGTLKDVKYEAIVVEQPGRFQQSQREPQNVPTDRQASQYPSAVR